MVVMGEHDPQADDVAPGNGGMPRVEVLAGEVAASPMTSRRRSTASCLIRSLAQASRPSSMIAAISSAAYADVGDALVVPAAHRSTD